MLSCCHVTLDVFACKRSFGTQTLNMGNDNLKTWKFQRFLFNVADDISQQKTRVVVLVFSKWPKVYQDTLDGNVSEWKASGDGNFRDIDNWVFEHEGITMLDNEHIKTCNMYEQILLWFGWTAIMGFYHVLIYSL